MAVRRIFALVLLLGLAAFRPMVGLGAPPVAVDLVNESLSLKYAATCMVDPSGRLGVQEAGAPRLNDRYRPLSEGLPWNSGGALWLRFSLFRNSPMGQGRQDRAALRLDLGRDAPAAKIYWAEKLNAEGEVRQWRDVSSSKGGVFLLPDPEFLPMTVYVRLEKLPTLWFDPLLIKGAPVGLETEQGWTLLLRGLLALTVLICLIRGSMKNGEWRFWAAGSLACAFVYAMYGDNGVEKGLISPEIAPQLLVPGLALMLMPHLGRYLLNDSRSGALDKIFIALSVPGALAALLPLTPGFGWTARLLPLIPLALFLPLLVTLFVARNRPGRGTCYALCLFFPLVGALAALCSLHGLITLPFREMGPQLASYGWLLGGVVMSMLGNPAAMKEKKDSFPDLGSYFPAQNLLEEEKKEEPPIDFEKDPVPDTGLRISSETPVQTADAEPEIRNLGEDDEEWLEGFALNEDVAPLREEEPDSSVEVLDLDLDLRVEEKTDPAPEDSLPPPEEESEEMVYIRDEEEPGLVLIKPMGSKGVDRVFNLSELIRRIQDQVLPLARSRGISLSWFVAPSLPLFYQGNEEKLTQNISFLMRGSVEAAESGAVRLNVDEAKDDGAGRLRFSLLEARMSIEKIHHSSDWMNRAWEMAQDSGLSFNADFSPDQGAAFSFTLEAVPSWEPDRRKEPESRKITPNLPVEELPAEKPNLPVEPVLPVEERPLREKSLEFLPPLREYVILLDPAASGRRLLKRQMEGLPHKALEAGSESEAIRLCTAQPVGLLIVDAEVPEADLRKVLEQVRAGDAAQGRSFTPVLALLNHESQAERMLRLGCTECQVKFISRPEFQEIVLRLCPHPEYPLHPEQADAGSRRMSMLDMIVHSLDETERNTPESLWRASLPEEKREVPAQGIADDPNDFMYAEMLPAIPDFLEALRESLKELEGAASSEKNLKQMEKAASLMVRQGKAYGLIPLVRMAVCVSEAAQSGEGEAATELAEELSARVRRYLNSLERTYKQHF